MAVGDIVEEIKEQIAMYEFGDLTDYRLYTELKRLVAEFREEIE